ncbi:MAG: STAS/SEC14 domain-containing protein [Xanthomonadales bacterium]|nr:STAS/SEC14 domain-containing protein [Xanthomonadales bacterium]
MLNIELIEDQSIAILSPDNKLDKEDFIQAGKLIDPFIQQNGHLNGLVIHTQKFPGWEDISALIAHFRFVHDHHKKIHRVALVSDSALLQYLKYFTKHFVAAEIKEFDYSELQRASDWAAAKET